MSPPAQYRQVWNQDVAHARLEPLGAHCTLVCFSRCVAISPMHFAGTSLASDLHQLATFWFSSGRLSTQSHAASCPVKCRYWLPTQFAAYSWVAAEGELFRLPVRWVVRKLFGRPHQSAWTVLRRTATAVRASRRSSPSYFPFHIWDVIFSIDLLSYFSEGLKPPTR